MKKSYLLSAAAVMLMFAGKGATATADYNVIPLPQSVEMKSGDGFNLKKSTTIVYPAQNKRLKKSAEFLADYIQVAIGMKLAVSDKPRTENAIVLSICYQHDNKEAYSIDIDSKRVVVDGAGEAGVFYGVQTLRKSIPVDAGTQIIFPQASIKDYPRFGYRGMMLDVCRHFFPIEFVKKYIDILALHNMNTFHWHLSDDQGWRIEIKKYPKLTEIGSMRKGTLVGHGRAANPTFDSIAYGGFYTQEQAREVVAYAAERYITVIPEIDLPGHMEAALASYPELGCTGGPYEVEQRWGVFKEVLCLGNDRTFDFLEGVFTEIMDIFPSKIIHIGGDECPRDRWKECPKCQKRIADNNLTADEKHTAEDRLQSYAMTRVEKQLNANGRSIIGWDEILEGGVAPNAIVMSWRGVKGGIEAAKLKHNVIMTPNSHLYFDFYQTADRTNEPLAIGGCTTVEKVYGYEPMPDELTAEQKRYILGVQANMWAEYLLSEEHVEYMLLPRLDALSEIQWTEPEKKNYDRFVPRLSRMTKLYDKLGYNYGKHAFVESAKPGQAAK